MTEKKITVAICTYNRADRLPALVDALRRQDCPIACEILAVDNNSKDNTRSVLMALAEESGTPLRYVKEGQQGIVYARNRAIEEAFGGNFMAFIDDDELPAAGWLNAAVEALDAEGADCVGGEIRACLPDESRPKWLSADLLGFLGEVRHGHESFWIESRATPVWSGNVGYRTSVFADGLRFNPRYNRVGEGIGGGSDEVMFNLLLEHGARIRYRPDMVIEHLVEDWKLRRGYFLKLHYAAGKKQGTWTETAYQREIFGIPPFMVAQAMRQMIKTIGMILRRKPDVLRQAMNVAHALGMMNGMIMRKRARG